MRIKSSDSTKPGAHQSLQPNQGASPPLDYANVDMIVERPPTERSQLERLAPEIAAVCPNAAEQCHSFAGFVDTLAASNLWELFFD